MIRRFGEPVRRDVAYRQRPGAYAILPLGRALLVTHQAEPEDEFQLPGGGIDPGESPIAALHREVLEETGWRISTPRRIGIFQRFTYMPEYGFWARKLCHIFCARPVRPLSAPKEAGHTAIWMTPDDAAKHLGNEGDRHFVSKWHLGRL